MTSTDRASRAAARSRFGCARRQCRLPLGRRVAPEVDGRAAIVLAEERSEREIGRPADAPRRELRGAGIDRFDRGERVVADQRRLGTFERRLRRPEIRGKHERAVQQATTEGSSGVGSKRGRIGSSSSTVSPARQARRTRR